MKKEDKNKIVDLIASTINEYDNFYLTDISTLNAEKTSTLRRECYKEDIKLMVVKNTLLRKAFDADTIMGISFSLFLNMFCTAKRAALALRVSKTVSIIIISTPPSTRALI